MLTAFVMLASFFKFQKLCAWHDLNEGPVKEAIKIEANILLNCSKIIFKLNPWTSLRITLPSGTVNRCFDCKNYMNIRIITKKGSRTRMYSDKTVEGGDYTRWNKYGPLLSPSSRVNYTLYILNTYQEKRGKLRDQPRPINPSIQPLFLLPTKAWISPNMEIWSPADHV